MDFRQMEYFLALAETANFTRAAERCGVMQPALTKAIQRLEHELGGALIFREGRATQLTPLGRAVLADVSECVAAARRLSDRARDAIQPHPPRLRIGVVPSVPPGLLLPALARAATQLPDLRIWLLEFAPDAVEAALLRQDLDLALLPAKSAVPERFEHWPVARDPIDLAAPSGHPLLSNAELTLDALRDEALLAPDGCAALNLVLALGDAHGIAFRVPHRAACADRAQDLCLAGLGMLVVPRHRPVGPGLERRALAHPRASLDVDLVAVRGRRRPAWMEALVRRVRAVA